MIALPPTGRSALRTAASFFFAMALLCVLYRLLLWRWLYGASPIPTGYIIQTPRLDFWKTVANDLGVSIDALGTVGLVGLFCTGAARITGRAFAFLWNGLPVLFAATLLGAIALVMRTHQNLVYDLNCGLTVPLLLQGQQQMNASSFWGLMRAGDIAFLFFPLAVFFLFFGFVRRPVKTAAFCGIAFAAVALGLQWLPNRAALPWEIAENPVEFLALDTVQAMESGLLQRKTGHPADSRDLPSPLQVDSIQLVDPAFAHAVPQKPAPRCPPAPQGKWNVLFFVLESVGAEYVFDTSHGELPMPFLQRMSREGLCLANHHASGNNSAKAAFSLFTGLYCRPDPLDVAPHVKALTGWLPKDYHAFLVIPQPTTYFFSLALLKNNGLAEIYDKASLPPGGRPDPGPLNRNELDAVDFLLQKIDESPAPFFGVYWSGLAHWPYPDYGEATHIACSDNPRRDAYYANLRALDTQLERVFNHLQATGKLQNTLLCFVGDHGEAFGRHPGIAIHGIGTYEETYRTPAILYQPALFSPRRIDWPTSHVDLLPTVLDALSVPYPVEFFQGESILRGEPARKYVFTITAAADYLSAIDATGHKVSLGLASPDRYAYNLAEDPLETHRLPSSAYAGEMSDLVKFANYQRQLIPRYDQSQWEGKPWGSTNTTPAATDR